MQGKDEESKTMATQALRLQGSISKTKPIVKEEIKTNTVNKRGDTYGRTVLRRKDHISVEEAVGKNFLANKSVTHNFGV